MKKKDLKKRIAKLESDLREVVLNPFSVKSFGIKMRIQTEKGLDDAIWYGSAGCGESTSLSRYYKTNENNSLCK